MTLFINSIVSILIISYIVFELIATFKKAASKNEKLFILVVSTLHFGAALAFVLLLDKLPNNDALKYYNTAVESANWFDLFSVGGFFVSFLIYPLVKLKVTIEVLFLLFSAISFKGFLEYFKLLNLSILNSKYLFLICFFLIPSIHFWTGFLGKEALLFLLMVVLLKQLKYKVFDWSFIVSFLLIFLIRPHVFFMILIAFTVVLLLEKGVSKVLKKSILLISTVSFLIFIPIFFMYFLKINMFDLDAIQEAFLGLARHSELNGNSKIDILNTSIFTRIGYLLFMPLPFLYDIKNSFQWMAAFENVYYIAVLIFTIRYFIKERFKFSDFKMDQKFALISGFLLIILFGSYLYNLGLGNRMRVMFLPYLFYTLITVINSKIQNEKETH